MSAPGAGAPPVEVDAVVLDIEGTVGATGFVVDVLYPYSRARLGALLAERAHEPRVRRAIEQVRELTGEPEADLGRVEKALHTWLAEDRKATPLKTLQGIVWAEGFARGELVSHFYPDVPPVLGRWRAAGLRLYVYSSGSVAAQRAWFRHSPEGDLLPLLSGLYDTENAGPKQAPESYRAIAADIAAAPERIVFLSDRRSELDAARAAGWRTVGVRRPGEPYYAQGVGDHPQAGSFDAIRLAGAEEPSAGAEDQGASAAGPGDPSADAGMPAAVRREAGDE